MLGGTDWLALISWFTFTFFVGTCALDSVRRSVRATLAIGGSSEGALQGGGGPPVPLPRPFNGSFVWFNIFSRIALGCASLSVFLVWGTQINPNVAIFEMSLAIYVFSLMLVLVWTHLFYDLRATGASVAVVFILIFSVLINTALFFSQNGGAGTLHLVYLLWVSFFVNANVWANNSFTAAAGGISARSGALQEQP